LLSAGACFSSRLARFRAPSAWRSGMRRSGSKRRWMAGHASPAPSRGAAGWPPKVVSACEMSCPGERLSERVGLQLFSRRRALGYWPKSDFTLSRIENCGAGCDARPALLTNPQRAGRLPVVATLTFIPNSYGRCALHLAMHSTYGAWRE
jgi:hypothetical protein